MNIYQEIRAGFQANVFFQAEFSTMKFLYVRPVKAMWEGVIVIPFSVMLLEHKILNSHSLLLTQLTGRTILASGLYLVSDTEA